MNDIVVPGVRLCESDDRHIAGSGAYLQELDLYIISLFPSVPTVKMDET